MTAALTQPSRSRRNPIADQPTRFGSLLLRAVPDCEPPFDDEPRSALHRLHAVRARSGALATPTAPRTPTPARHADLAGPVRTAPSDRRLPPAGRVGPALARALVEVLGGARPAVQLRDHSAPDVLLYLLQRQGRVKPNPVRLLSAHVCEPSAGVAEVSAVYRRAERTVALAFRLEIAENRWQISALEPG